MGVKLAGVICCKNDRRASLAIDSLASQVDYLLVVDSSDSPGTAKFVQWVCKQWQERFAPDDRVGFLHRPELNLPQAKNRAVSLLKDMNYVAFIDGDMTVPEDWGEMARAAISQSPDIVVGLRIMKSSEKYLSYHVEMERQHYYDFRNPLTASMVPQDNTLWSLKVLQRLEGFDERFATNGEDLDLGIRAWDAGYAVTYESSLKAFHTRSHLDSIPRILRKRFDYFVGGAMAGLKNGTLRSKVRKRKVYHAVQLLDLPMKMLAVLVAKMRLTR